MKSDVDYWLAARSYVRRKLDFYPADTAEEIAEDCGCCQQLISRIERSALDKVRVRLAERGVSRVEALMVLEVLGRGEWPSRRWLHSKTQKKIRSR